MEELAFELSLIIQIRKAGICRDGGNGISDVGTPWTEVQKQEMEACLWGTVNSSVQRSWNEVGKVGWGQTTEGLGWRIKEFKNQIRGKVLKVSEQGTGVFRAVLQEDTTGRFMYSGLANRGR